MGALPSKEVAHRKMQQVILWHMARDSHVPILHDVRIPLELAQVGAHCATRGGGRR